MEIEKINEALQENTELQGQLLESLIKSDAGQQLLNNHAELYAKTKINEKTREYYGAIDEMLSSYGLQAGEKGPGKLKTMDALKASLDALTAQQQASTEAKAEEEKQAQSYRKKYEELQALAGNEKQELVDKLQALQSEMQNAKQGWVVNSQLESATSSLEYNPNFPALLIDSAKKMAVKELQDGAKFEDGKVTYHKPDGTPYLNAMYEPMTASEILKDKLKEVLMVNTPGGGANPNPAQKQEGNNSNISIPVTTVNSRVEFEKVVQDYAKSLGVTQATNRTKFFEIYRAAQQQFNYDSLPLT